jgi:DNA modification methylase
MSRLQILTGDCRDILPTLSAQSVQCCVTSPPYWGLRDYGTAEWEGGSIWCEHRKAIDPIFAVSTSTLDGGKKTTGHLQEGYKDECPRCGARRIDQQLGLEATPAEYIANMVAVFREVKRVLRDDGTLWLNVGDSYCANQGNGFVAFKDGERSAETMIKMKERKAAAASPKLNSGLKPKDLCMMPARLAMALQADGWYLRSEIVWHKPNPMPESVTDRPTKAHEMIYLLAKQERYFYDAEAIREIALRPEGAGNVQRQEIPGQRLGDNSNLINGLYKVGPRDFRNKRTVWTIATQPYAEAHFATFPEEIPKLCIMAGSRVGDTVLDPFAGSGTVGQVALELGRRAILIELNPAYIELAEDRTFVTPGFL